MSEKNFFRRVGNRITDLFCKALGWDETIAIVMIIIIFTKAIPENLYWMAFLVIAATLTTRAVDKGMNIYKTIKGK